MSEYSLFTSESVSEGHPDKIADQISDAVLDAIIAEDKFARVACETLVKTGVAIIAGEVTTSAWVDLEQIVRDVITDIGYTSSDVGFDGATCGVMNIIGKQSPDINQGVDRAKPEDQGAGDQGLMFGYASNETDVLMPAPITFSHQLVQRQAEARKSGLLPWLRPDAKSQVTCRYEGGKVVGIDAVVLSTQHNPEVSYKDLREGVMELIVKHVLPAELLTKDTQFHINPTGQFIIGGPVGDCGLTGRKIIVDSYGGMARHGGGAFSGKDPSKVDRSAAYAGRYVAKNIVAAGLAERCEIQVSYAIGVAQPTSISLNTFGTGKISDDKIVKLVREVFDLRPYAITTMLDLLHPMYQETAAYGHFGRTPATKTVGDDTFTTFTWEKTDRADAPAHRCRPVRLPRRYQKPRTVRRAGLFIVSLQRSPLCETEPAAKASPITQKHQAKHPPAPQKILTNLQASPSEQGRSRCSPPAPVVRFSAELCSAWTTNAAECPDWPPARAAARNHRAAKTNRPLGRQLSPRRPLTGRRRTLRSVPCPPDRMAQMLQPRPGRRTIAHGGRHACPPHRPYRPGKTP